MPLAGTHDLAALAVKAALDAVSARWRGRGELPAADIDAMKLEMEAARCQAIFAHIIANATVAGTAAGAALGGPGAPLVGTLT
jgi:hypothetical protein